MHFFYFLQKSLKIFSKISQIIVFFVKTRENLARGFEIILKIDQNSAFLLFSEYIFESVLKCFHNNCVFRPKRENLTQGYLRF